MNNPLLSTEEKRRWLARVFRDTDGEYSQADKFKALVEDTKLAALQQEEEELKRRQEKARPCRTPSLPCSAPCLRRSLPRKIFLLPEHRLLHGMVPKSSSNTAAVWRAFPFPTR